MFDPVAAAGRKASLAILSNVAGAGLGYLALLLIGRYFAPAAYGSYLFAMSATGLLALLSNLGIGTAHQRHIAQGIEPGCALGVLVRLRAAIGLGLLALVAIAYLAWSGLAGKPVTDATTPLVLGLAVALQMVAGSRQVLLDTWQGQQKVNRVELVRQLDTFLVLVLLANAALLMAHLEGRWEVIPAVGAFWSVRLGLDTPLGVPQAALLLGGCYLLAKTATLAIAWAWSLRDAWRLGPWDTALARSYGRVALPFALTGALALVLVYTDTLLLGFFWTAREVGLYGTAQKLAALCLLGATAVGAVLLPRFAQWLAAGDQAGEAATFDRAQRYLTLLAAPVAAAMVALPREGLHVAVGDAYLAAAVPLQLLALWALVFAMETPMAARFMGRGQTGLLVRSAGLNVGLNVLLNVVLIPPQMLGWGPAGAATATLLSTGLSYAYMRKQSRAHHGLPWVDAGQVRILAAGAAATAFWWSARVWAGAAWFDRVWELGLWGVAGLGVYVAVLAVAGELHAHDLAFLRKVAHPRSLLAELRGR